jgi:tight adherence protein C
MFAALDITAPGAPMETYLTVRLGEMQFGSLDTSIVVLSLAAALVSALNLWRIGTREDREKRLLGAVRRYRHHGKGTAQIPRAPWYQRLGAEIAETKIIGTAKQEGLLSALVAAGIKGHGHLAALITAKFCFAAALVPLCWMLLEWRQSFADAPTIKLIILAGAGIFGWHCPEVVLSRLATRRRIRLENGMPDAFDLLVICTQAGLSLDHAIEQVGRFLRPCNTEVSKEFAATATEMRVLPVRTQALENMAERTGLASLRSMVVTLNQSIKFGTSLTESLKILAAEMRIDRLARFEERAARLPVLLTLPLMIFVLPSLMMVIGTPLVLRILDALGRVS